MYNMCLWVIMTYITENLQGGVKVPTGGKARERESVDSVILIRRFRSRQYSLDGRRTYTESRMLGVCSYIDFSVPEILSQGLFVLLGKSKTFLVTQKPPAGCARVGSAGEIKKSVLRSTQSVEGGSFMDKEGYMRRALALAAFGEGYVSPNPMVGCVVVKDGRIISEGYHEHYGEFHAERNALTRCSEDTKGADLYVTLEPCCHYGQTPPCTEIIIEKKIRRVFVGSMDVNPLVAGKGVQILRDHGMEVETGILEKECLKLNEVFYHYMQTKLPFVVMKYAMTLDGKIACATGDSKWVTGECARAEVHQMRKRYKGIMVGIETVLADDPMLNCRVAKGVDPVRIVCDSKLRIPVNSRIVETANEIPTIVACCQNMEEIAEKREKMKELQAAGVQIITTGCEVQPDAEQGAESSSGEGRAHAVQHVNLKELMQKLGEQKIDSILLEGGGTLNASALQAGIVSKVYAYLAGKLVGGRDARSPVEGSGIDRMCDAISLREMEITRLGEDVCISGYPIYKR